MDVTSGASKYVEKVDSWVLTDAEEKLVLVIFVVIIIVVLVAAAVVAARFPR